METVLLALIVLLSFTVEATAGFGATLVTVTLAAHVLPIERVLAVYMPVNLLLSLWLMVRHRRSVAWRLLLLDVLPAMGVGTAAGLWLIHLAGFTWIRRAFALFVVALSALELLRGRRSELRGRLATAPRTGLLLAAGFTHGLFATGGPLAVYVTARELPDKASFRATLCALWFLLNSALVVDMLATGRINGETAPHTAVLLIPMVLGIALGERIHAATPADRFRAWIFAGLLVAGAILLIRA